jgi:hypothetical protein
MRLIRGSVASTVMKTVRFEMAKAPQPAESPVSVEPLLQMMQGFLMSLDFILRMGIPVTYEVTQEQGRYVITPVEVLGQPVEENEEPLIMSRVGLRSLAVIVDGKIQSRGILTLNQHGQVDQDFIGVENDPDIGPIEFGMKLKFKRQ